MSDSSNLFDVINHQTLDSVRTYSDDEIVQGTFGPKAVSENRVQMEDRDMVDPITGTAEAAKVYERRRQYLYGGTLSLVCCKNLLEFFQTHRLVHQEIQVLAYALDKSLYYNYVKLAPKELQEVLGLSPSAVSKTTAKLVEVGVIRKLGKSEIAEFMRSTEHKHWYQLSLDLFWRGDTAERPKEPKGYKIGNRVKDREMPSLEQAFFKSNKPGAK